MLTAPLILMIVVLACHVGLSTWIGLRNAPNDNEASHLAAGIYNWQLGRFDLYSVNPPLVRVLATLPVVLANPVIDRKDYRDLTIESNSAARPEWSAGIGFVRDNKDWAKWYFAWARWMLIPLGVLGGYFSWRWAGECYGASAGLVALVLWCFSPNVLAWSATICPDTAAASLGVIAGYWTKRLRRGCASGL